MIRLFIALHLFVGSTQGFAPRCQYPLPTITPLRSPSGSSRSTSTKLFLQLLDDPHLLDTLSSLMMASDDAPPEVGGISYSKASYYTILGLYVMSLPGLYSTIQRSTTAKMKRKTFVAPGEKAPDKNGKTLRQQAGEIMACKYKRLGAQHSRTITVYLARYSAARWVFHGPLTIHTYTTQT